MDAHATSLLLKYANINVNLKNEHGITPLIRCCYEGDKSLQIAKLLLARNDINVNLQANDGCTPLLMCCQQGDSTSLQIANTLLAHKDIDVNLPENDGWTPLIMCCYEGDKSLQIAQSLLQYKKITLNNPHGPNPLDKIMQQILQGHKNYQYVKLWNLLVVKGAMLNLHQKTYNSLNLNNFQEPQQTYVRLIKQNPPKNSTNTKLMDNKEETKEDE